MNRKAGLRTTRAETIGFVVPMTALTWLLGTVMVAQSHGLARAAIVAGFSVVGGLIIWMIHWSVSRRSNGLAGFFILTLGPSVSEGATVPFPTVLRIHASVIVATALGAVLLGLLTRKSEERVGGSSDSQLWDAEIDPPAAR